MKTNKEKALDEEIHIATRTVAEEGEAPLDHPDDLESATEQVSRKQWEELISQAEPLYLPTSENQRK